MGYHARMGTTSQVQKTNGEPAAGAGTALDRGPASYLDEAAARSLQNRLARIEGQVRALRRMVAEGRCADEILVQAAAARGALAQFGLRILERHLAACAATCMGRDLEEVTARVGRAAAAALKLAT